MKAVRVTQLDGALPNLALMRLAAWDNIGDEDVFFAGVDRLERAGVRPDHLMVYMLVGYDKRETWERLIYRYDRMMARGVKPYPMVHDRHRQADNEHWRKLKRFQGWVITGAHIRVPFAEFRPSHAAPIANPDLFLSKLGA